MKSKTISITSNCSMSCSYCVAGCPAVRARDEILNMTVREYKIAIDGFDGVVLLTGGQPTLHPSFEEFVYLHTSKNNPVVVYTNGVGEHPHINNPDVFWVFGAHRKYRSDAVIRELLSKFPVERTIVNNIQYTSTYSKLDVGEYNLIDTDDVTSDHYKLAATDTYKIDYMLESQFITPDGLIYKGFCDKIYHGTLLPYSELHDGTKHAIETNPYCLVNPADALRVILDNCVARCQITYVNNYILDFIVESPYEYD